MQNKQTNRAQILWVCITGFSYLVASFTLHNPAWAGPQCEKSVSIALLGDVFVTKRVLSKSLKFGESMSFLPKKFDLVIGNLEGALTEHETRAFPEQPFAHKMPPAIARQFSQWGFRGFTLANNHSMDYGKQGLSDTMKNLKSAGIAYAGAGLSRTEAEMPMILNSNGLKIHVLSFNATFPEGAWANDKRAGVAYPYMSSLQAAVKRSVAQSDFVIVAFHWGEESSRSLRDYQPTFAHAAIEAGADFVYGHHAHVAQAIEVFARDKANLNKQSEHTIAYGLGNFIFDSYSRKASFGLAALLSICKQSQELNKKINSVSTRALAKEIVFLPLNTNTFETHFQTKPMNLSEFKAAAQIYVDERLFPAETLFWIPSEQKTQSLNAWLAKNPRIDKSGPSNIKTNAEEPP